MTNSESLTDLFNQFVLYVENDSGLMASGLVLEEFSSKNPVYRLNIRLGIVESNVFSKSEALQIVDLNQRPKSSDWHFSISHSDVIGGYLQSNTPIGLDIERSDRVQRRIIQRVSTEKEMAEAPGPDFLWTAKEAVFKALSLEVMSQAIVEKWQPCSLDKTFKFSCRTTNELKLKHNIGYSQRIMDHNWTIFFY